MGIIVILVALYFPKGIIYYLKQKLNLLIEKILEVNRLTKNFTVSAQFQI